MFNKKNDTIEFAKLEVKCQFLEQENEKLNKQVEKLQEALIASTAPKAFDAMQRDKSLPDTKEEMEARMKMLKEHAYVASYLEEMEKPSFDGVDEMTNWLSSGYAKTSMADTPIDEGNKES